ncbi:polysulfide reductase NrfD [archaeon]|nr:polysulfide reductase NrfD [archaeon]
MLYEQWLWDVPKHAQWGWIIALYLFLGGVGAGAHITAGMAWILNKKNKGTSKGEAYERINRAGAYLGPPTLIIGTTLLLFELGDPLRGMLMYVAYINPTSWMAVGAWLLFILISTGVANMVYWSIGKSSGKRFKIGILGIPLGFTVAAYTGYLLSAAQFVPLWNEHLLPLLFTISAISTGIAATCLFAFMPIFGPITFELKKGATLFSKIDALLIITEIAVLCVFLMEVKAFGGAGLASVNLLTMGRYAVFFWGGVVFLGLLVPLIFSIHSFKKTPRAKYLTFEFGLVLLGGLILRFVILFGAIKQPIVIP